MRNPDQTKARKLAKTTDDLASKLLVLQNGSCCVYPEYSAFCDAYFLLKGIPSSTLSQTRLMEAEALMFEAPHKAIQEGDHGFFERVANLTKHFAKTDSRFPADWLATRVLEIVQGLSWEKKKLTAYAVAKRINEQIQRAQGFSSAAERARLIATRKRLSPRMCELLNDSIKRQRAAFFYGGDPARGPYEERQIREVMKRVGLISDRKKHRKPDTKRRLVS